MSRWKRSIVMLGTMASLVLPHANVSAFAPDIDGPDSALRAQMAAITLDATTLPSDYRLQGETFLNATQVAGNSIDPALLRDSGFLSQYISGYRNPDTGLVITSYVSAWTDADTAAAGFNLVEDEASSAPTGAFSDTSLSLGETPSELTTGTYPSPDGSGNDVAVADATFRIGKFLVGVSLTTLDGSQADVALIQSLAGTLEARATAVLGNQSPDGTSLELVARATPLFDLGIEYQAGFLDIVDVEAMYGLQGSALGRLQASWVEVVGSENGVPYLATSVTTFSSVEDANAVFQQLSELSPVLEGEEILDGVRVSGADATIAASYQSPATASTENDSVRISMLVGATIAVADVQGSDGVEAAQAAAIAIASAQAVCLGETQCVAPELPAGNLAANVVAN